MFPDVVLNAVMVYSRVITVFNPIPNPYTTTGVALVVVTLPIVVIVANCDAKVPRTICPATVLAPEGASTILFVKPPSLADAPITTDEPPVADALVPRAVALAVAVALHPIAVALLPEVVVRAPNAVACALLTTELAPIAVAPVLPPPAVAP